MDGLQPYSGAHRPLVTVHPAAASPPAAKTAGDYLGAIRRRIWLALAVAIPIATVGTWIVLRLPAVYSVTATIEIKPPRVDPAVAHLVSNGDITPGGDATDEKYIPDTIAMLSSKSLLDKVVRNPSLGLPDTDGDPAAELVGKIKARQHPLSHIFYLTYEGRDPNLIVRTLNHVVAEFCKRADLESRDAREKAREKASVTRDEYIKQLAQYQEDLDALIIKSKDLAPGGRSIRASEYEALKQRYWHQQEQVKSLQTDLQLSSMTPAAPAGSTAKAQKIEVLEGKRVILTRRIAAARRISRIPSDPSVVQATNELREVDDALARLQAPEAGGAGMSREEAAQQIVADAQAGIGTTQGQIEATLAGMKDAMPDHQKFLTLNNDRDAKAKQLGALKDKLSAFAILADTQKPPVRIIDEASEPTVPIKPNRAVFIAGCIVLSLGLGLGLVCLLEHLDHSVKVPEHLTAGLALPLFGVVPRMRRNARNHRGGHLWTPGLPDSIEADAYRNLRASLLGVTVEGGPIVTLLVTSAKAGEGKSTTALNLAATCARAGERTLLMDVDLRRPSLNEVFPTGERTEGLVDVLRGDLPWQRTVVQTDLPNLDFLPTGDTRDVPIEVLGSLELRQLLLSLSQHHYDRVILDGPAVLGLADCRMLGRVVDAAVMVVRSGSQELRSLQRAKAMLEQSRVPIAGLVFNGLADDLDNWSSYGPMAGSPIDVAHPRPAGASRGLGARNPGAAAALMATGPVEA